MKALAIVAALAGATGVAEAGVHVTRGDDAVIVLIDGGAVGGAVAGGKDHVDVPLIRGAEHDQDLRLPDRLVRKIELGDGKVRIKLRTNRRRTRAIAAAVQVRTAGADLEIVIPRDPRAAVAALAPVVEPEAEVEPVIEPASEAGETAAPEVLTAPEAAPSVDAPATPRAIATGSSSKIPWGSLALVLGVVCAAALVIKRRRTRTIGGGASPLELRTSLAVGPKARVHLLAAGDRELLVAVDPRGVRLLDSWSRDVMHDDGPVTTPPVARALSPGEARPSPVAGLVQLRRASQADVDAELGATADADAWSRELLISLQGQAERVVNGASSAVQMVVVLTLVSLVPAIVLTCTCFARFVIVLGFVRTGLGTQSAPPNQVLIGTALFMTAFVMAPTAERVHTMAIAPYMAGQIAEAEAADRATPPIREFLLAHTREEDLALFYDVSDAPRPASADDVPLRIAIPAFVLSELRTSFEMGLTVLVPFLVIDLVVALVLTAMGMMMMPPTVVALPIKLLVFVAVDGWHLLVGSLLRGAM